MKNEFEKDMEKQIEKTFNEADTLVKKLPNVEKLRKQVEKRLQKISSDLDKYVIKMPVNVKIDKEKCIDLVYVYKNESGHFGYEGFGIFVRFKRGGTLKLWEIKDDELYLKCALAIPELLRKIKNEANKLKRELCKEIDNEIEEEKQVQILTENEQVQVEKHKCFTCNKTFQLNEGYPTDIDDTYLCKDCYSKDVK